MEGYEALYEASTWVWLFASLGTTSFPVLYAFSNWTQRFVGRALMCQSIAVAFAVNFTTVLYFFPQWGFGWFFAVLNVIMPILLGLTGLTLTALMWELNHPYRRRGNLMKNKVYDRLKWGNLVALPAVSVFYVALAVIWGFPEVDKVVGTIAAVEVLLGTLLGISNAKYKANQPEAEPVAALGAMNVTDSEDGVSFMLKLDGDPTELQDGQKVLFSVNRPGS